MDISERKIFKELTFKGLIFKELTLKELSIYLCYKIR
jgi:hypothetical protein